MKKEMKVEIASMGLNGDLDGILTYLESNKSNLECQVLFKKLNDRFITKNELIRIRCKNPVIKSIGEVYQKYYKEVFSKSKNIKESEKYLLTELNKLIIQYSLYKKAFDKLDDLEKFLIMEVKNQGYFSVFGTISPYRFGCIWIKEDVNYYDVELPQHTEKVKVIFISKFILKSWINYFSLGIDDMGGWAEKEQLYCIKNYYNLDSEKFKMNYLKHEAQHFADYKLFPNIKLEDYSLKSVATLEYRAKLVELIYFSKPNSLMRAFIIQMKDNHLLPHPYGAFQLVQDIVNELNLKEIKQVSDWKSIKAERIRVAARTIFLRDEFTV